MNETANFVFPTNTLISGSCFSASCTHCKQDGFKPHALGCGLACGLRAPKCCQHAGQRPGHPFARGSGHICAVRRRVLKPGRAAARSGARRVRASECREHAGRRAGRPLRPPSCRLGSAALTGRGRWGRGSGVRAGWVGASGGGRDGCGGAPRARERRPARRLRPRALTHGPSKVGPFQARSLRPGC